MAETPYLETEILLDVLNENYGAAIKKLRDMTGRERMDYLENLTDTIDLINAVNQAGFFRDQGV